MRSFANMEFDDNFFQIIRNALKEDIGNGDHSTLCCIDKSAVGKAILKVKQEDVIIAGVEVAKQVLSLFSTDSQFSIIKFDGERVKNGDHVFEVVAPVHTILKCERLILNIMQRMSGIATLTDKYVQKIAHYPSKLLDTRKTTPNFRIFEKEAVVIGGGYNHRFGLYDMIMLKDNHIDFCGSIEKAIQLAAEYVKSTNQTLKIEVEARSLEDVRKIKAVGMVDRIMFDNFNPAQIIAALSIIEGQFETEASGGIHLDNIVSYAETGVDFISCGALIHQAQSVDLSLKAVIL
jgi:nicotinate-nucleotide pyrophosphorylase (carboxylating)